MRAKRYLQQIEKLDALIKNKMIERQQFFELATSTTAQFGGEHVSSSGNPQKMADAMNEYIDLEKEVKSRIDELIKKRQEILSVIEQLSPSEYDFLHSVYVQRMTLNEVADERGMSYSWATTLHGRALKSVQKILDEMERGNDEF